MVIQFINTIVKKIGEMSSLLSLVLIGLICIDVVLRYTFNTTYNWVIELEWQVFGLIFLLGSAYTFQVDKHVRVDVFYNNFSQKWKNVIDVLGSLFLLIPWCWVGIVTCYNYASNSLYIREGSPNPGGLPAWYVVKFAIVFCFILLLIQAVTIIFEKVQKLSS